MKIDDAKRILVHYFQAIARRAGQPFDADCIAEIEAAVDCIYEAARDDAIAEVYDRYLQ